MRGWLPWLALTACVPHPTNPPVARVSIATLPSRAYSLSEAKEQIWHPELRPPFQLPTRAEASAVRRIVPELMLAAGSGSIDPGVIDLAATVGMRIERWQIGGGATNLVYLEAPDQRRGAGAYLFSTAHPASGPTWVLLEAPHAYHDKNTGTIAAMMYLSPPPGAAPSAFFTNTTHRYTQRNGERDEREFNPADACHSRGHLLNLATQAAARAASGAKVVQLHGFDGNEADDGGGRPPPDTLAVLSGGEPARPTPLAEATTERLKAGFGVGIRLFPIESSALGATTNVQRLGLKDAPRARFLHVEASDRLRELLLQDPSRRDAFAAALFESPAE